jgi:hypothetical protein
MTRKRSAFEAWPRGNAYHTYTGRRTTNRPDEAENVVEEWNGFGEEEGQNGESDRG